MRNLAAIYKLPKSTADIAKVALCLCDSPT